MDTHMRRINRNMMAGWLIIVAVLLVTYAGEVIKGTRTVGYLLTFIPVVVLPALVTFIIYRRNPGWKRLCFLIVPGYFVMYIFVMLTGSTTMVFSYILPLLALLVLCHHPGLILATGLASLAINAISIVNNFRIGVLTMANSRDAEIQIALIALCFGGSYIAARLYDDITRENADYVRILNNKNDQIRQMTMRTIQRLALTLDAKDAYTEGHSDRVAGYVVQLALALGMSAEEVDNLRLVALLHDVGKIVIPDEVLNKPGRLTDEEFEQMKRHTVIGSDIIKDIDLIPGVGAGARSHHERYDGRGYPDGLKGEEIPYVARIIAVADAYDAMTSNRVYRKHLTREKVLDEIEKGVGTQFDPEIATLLIKLLRSGQFRNLSPDVGDGVKE